MTTLHEACRKGDLSLVKRLLYQPGGNVNVREGPQRRGWTPLLCATAHVDVFSYLYERGADLNARDLMLRATAFHIATKHGHLPVLKWIVDHQHQDAVFPLTRQTDSASESALHYAVRRGDLKLVKFMVEVAKIDVCIKSRRGRLAVDLAVQSGHSSIANYLLRIHEFVRIYDDEETDCEKSIAILHRNELPVSFVYRDSQLIHTACYRGDLEMVQVLLEQGVDLDIPDTRGRTPLSNACSNGQKDVVVWLCQQGVDVNRPGESCRRPLAIAAANGHVDVAEVLLAFDAHIHNPQTNHAPLWLPCFRGHTPMVRFLLQNGATVNFRDSKRGWTPLFAACRHGHSDVVEALLCRHHEIAAEDWSTSLQKANDLGHIDVVKVMVVPKIIELVKGSN